MKSKKLAVWGRRVPGYLIRFIWAGLCAVAMLTQTRLVYRLPYAPDVLDGFILTSTFFAYNVVLRGRWIRRAAWFSGVIALVLVYFLQPQRQWTIGTLGILWCLYYGVGNPTRTGLRTSPIAKPMLVAFAWAGATVLLPLPWVMWSGSITLFMGRAAFIFALAIAYDLHDRDFDRNRGLLTLANQLPDLKVFRLVNTALAFTAVCVLIRWLQGDIALQVAGALWVSLLLSAGIIFGLFRCKTPLNWRKMIIDGLMLLQTTLVWLAI